MSEPCNACYRKYELKDSDVINHGMERENYILDIVTEIIQVI